MTGLHFVSSIRGSIYEISSNIMPFLEKEFDITKEWYFQIPEKRDILLCHFLDPDVIAKKEAFNTFKVKALIQPVDGTNIKKEFVDAINDFDVIFTPATAGREIMIKNGVTKPIHVIPNFYKDDLFTKEIYTPIEKYIPTDKVIFYHESTFHPRKGIDTLYECFIRAFSNHHDYQDVALVLKDLPYNELTFDKIEALKRQAIQLQKTYKYTPEIIKFSAHLETTEMKSLWNRADIYVSFAKIEGFGIPLLRMHLLNKPIVCLKNENSGYKDYLNDYNSYMIDTFQVEAQDELMTWLYEKETKWATPIIKDGVDVLRKCYTDFKSKSVRRLERDVAKSLKDAYYKKFSLETVAEQYVELLKSTFKTKSR